MVTVDLRNHGRSTNIEGLLPPHDLKNTARDIANLAKYLDIWPDVVVGHSLGGKVVLQYALSSAQGDYGDSTQLPKQVWVLDCGPGAYEGGYGTEEALYSLKTLPTPIPSKEWLADYIINLGFPKFKADWICSSLKKSGEQWLLSFNVDVSKLDWNVSHHKDEGNSCERDTDYWQLLEHPPKDMEIAVVRTENWDPDVAERLESLAKRESDESTGKVSVDVVSNSGHWIYRDQPEKLMEIMTPRLGDDGDFAQWPKQVNALLQYAFRDADYSALLEQPPKDMEIAIVRTESWASDAVERLESLLRGKVMNPEAESWLMLVPILDTGSTTYAPRDYDSRLASLIQPNN
ncbi:protein ABHD11 [Tanacetum coccineum]